MQRNSLATLLLYVLLMVFLLQVARGWPEVQVLAADLLRNQPGQAVPAWSEGHLVTLVISGCQRPDQFTALVNGRAVGTFQQGRCTLQVADGDLLEVDGYVDQVARVAVISTGRGVQLPVVGQEVFLADYRVVVARVLFKR